MAQDRRRSLTGTRPRRAEARMVMIVDDDASCLSAVDEIVNRWGHETITFSSFAEARAFLAGATPEAAIVDVRLGDYNGLQLLHLVHQGDPDTLLFAVSGFDDPVLRAEADRLGAVYLTKPIDLAELQARLSVHVISPAAGQ